MRCPQWRLGIRSEYYNLFEQSRVDAKSIGFADFKFVEVGVQRIDDDVVFLRHNHGDVPPQFWTRG